MRHILTLQSAIMMELTAIIGKRSIRSHTHRIPDTPPVDRGRRRIH